MGGNQQSGVQAYLRWELCFARFLRALLAQHSTGCLCIGAMLSLRACNFADSSKPRHRHPSKQAADGVPHKHQTAGNDAAGRSP